MDRCFGCGCMWADLDEDGRPITSEYCHFDGPDEWAPCMQDEEPDGYWDWALSGDYDEISDETLEAINDIGREF